MKYAILLALLACAVHSQEEIEDAAPSIEEAAMFLPMYRNRMGYNAMANQMMAQPPQQAIEYYSKMSDEDFPVDYSLACSNSCGCRTYCVVMWWIPCNCMCPPVCPSPTSAPEAPIGRFPTTEFPVNQPPRLPPRFTTTQAPRLPPRFTTTQAPRWPQPEPINPPSWNRPPVWGDPNNPNNFPTHAPQTRGPSTTQAPNNWNPRPPNVWNPNPNPWDPNNPKNRLTHPPATTTTAPRVWWPQQPQQPQQPQWPSPEPLPDQNIPWWQQQQPQQPPRLEDIGPCDDTCSCTPCTIIWICPPQCSALCCASRRFGEAEKVDAQEAESNNENAMAKFQYPDYLKDIFIPGTI